MIIDALFAITFLKNVHIPYTQLISRGKLYLAVVLYLMSIW